MREMSTVICCVGEGGEREGGGEGGMWRGWEVILYKGLDHVCGLIAYMYTCACCGRGGRYSPFLPVTRLPLLSEVTISAREHPDEGTVLLDEALFI